MDQTHPATGPARTPSPMVPAMIRVELLRRIDALVEALGGDPAALLARFGLDPAILRDRHAVVSFAQAASLFETAARELACPDFGMRLAALQARSATSGPLYVAMRHSPTLGAALVYAARHAAAYTTGTAMTLEPAGGAVPGRLVRFRIVQPGGREPRQVLEHALTLLMHHIQSLTHGRVRARAAWVAGRALAPSATYRAYLGCPVEFERGLTGLVFAEADLAITLADTDPWLYELADSYIARHTPAREPGVAERARAAIERLLPEGDPGLARVAAALAMHPRTLQRRLAGEGARLEMIKDAVRRDAAHRHLVQAELPLARVAQLLGYADVSALSRACRRWFGMTPGRLRAAARR